MKPQHLLIEIVKSLSADGVKEVLDRYAESQGLDSHLDLPNASFGGREANAHSIHAMSDVGNAAYEKITNMHDAVIEHLQRIDWFRSNPQNATEALREIGQRQDENPPGVYVATATAAAGLGKGRRSKHETNVSFIDEGVGIRPEMMPATILSLGGSNKLSNPLMAGCYGQGGSAIHAFTDFSLVFSRSSADPSVIGFTVVYEIFPKGARAPAYAYLTNPDGSIISIAVADIDPSKMVEPAALDGGSDIHMPEIIASKLILPRHGTVVKVWSLSNSPFSKRSEAYAFLRDKGFSIQAPTRLRVGTNPVSGEILPDGKRRLSVVGMRDLLSGTVARGGGRDSFKNLAHNFIRGEAFGGQADIHCWVRDYVDADKPHASSVIEAITQIKERVIRPIYVTLNGMTHFNLPSAVLLRNARLEWLAPHLMMEIDIDRLDVQRKGRIFTSSRENMKTEALDELKDDIDRWLREQASDPNSQLSKANAELRDRAMRAASSSANSRAYTENFVRMMKSSVFGAILSSISAPSKSAGRGDGVAGPVGSGDETGRISDDRTMNEDAEDRIAPDIVLSAIPTRFKVTGITLRPGDRGYVRILTDAEDSWSSAISIDLPEFLKLQDDPVLENGRMSCLVEAVGPAGSVGTIRARLDLSDEELEDLEDEAAARIALRVPPPEADDVARSPKAKGSMPEVTLIEISPSSPEWNTLANGLTDPARLAMTYIADRDALTVLWNRDFPPFVAASAHVEKGVSASASDRLLAETQTCARLLALMHLNSGAPKVTEEDKISWGQSLAANAIQTATTMIVRKRSGTASHDPEGLFGGL